MKRAGVFVINETRHRICSRGLIFLALATAHPECPLASRTPENAAALNVVTEPPAVHRPKRGGLRLGPVMFTFAQTAPVKSDMAALVTRSPKSGAGCALRCRILRSASG